MLLFEHKFKMSCQLRRRLLRRRGSFTVAPQRASPVAGPVRIVPQFESFYTVPSIMGPSMTVINKNHMLLKL